MTASISTEATAAFTAVIRETPPISPASAPDPADPSTPDASAEPVLDVNEIQGNVVAGFNKDHVLLLFLRIDDPTCAKQWLAHSIVGTIASTEEVIAFNRLFKSTRRGRRFEGTVKSTWINIAFSAAGMSRLTSDAAQFSDAAFQAGAAASSPSLNDPTAQDSEAAPVNWYVGGPANPADIVLTVASDDPYDLYATVQHLEDNIYSQRIGGVPAPSGVSVVFKQRGETQLGALKGHEHFGWLDGVSQPGLRGRLSDLANDVLTPRQNTDDQNQGKPGQDLLWPGEFVFGYPGQDLSSVVTAGADSLAPTGSAVAPSWAKNGSYLVFRRLRQDVGGFHQFLHDQAAPLSTTAEALGSRLVGRWPSGAPVLRAPLADDPKMGADDCANNHFEFQGATPPSTGDGLTQCNDSSYPASPGDQAGLICPVSAHIRKTYPRDDKPLQGANPYGGSGASPALDEADTQTHRLLRRGIPYGASSTSTPRAPLADGVDRGLLFMAYMTSIVDQFEFVTQQWVNNTAFKDEGTGTDPILGQTEGSQQRQARTAIPGNEATQDLFLSANWVVPTGAGYFFAPSISALRDVLAA